MCNCWKIAISLIEVVSVNSCFLGVSLRRTENGPEVRIFRASHPPEVNPETKTYYVLNLSTITHDVNRAIASRKGK